jgi:hypothetical protein
LDLSRLWEYGANSNLCNYMLEYLNESTSQLNHTS